MMTMIEERVDMYPIVVIEPPRQKDHTRYYIAWVNRRNPDRRGLLKGDHSRSDGEDIIACREALNEEDHHWLVPAPKFKQMESPRERDSRVVRWERMIGNGSI